MGSLFQVHCNYNKARIIGYQYVRILFLTAFFVVCFTHSIYAQYSDSTCLTQDAQQVLFLGNSITYDGRYVSMVESVILGANPKVNLNFINLGLPSETVSGLSEEGHAGGKFPRPCLFDRIDNILEKTNPDIVFVSYGMNDGIFKPFDEDRFKAYKQGMNKLYEDLLSEGVKRIIVMTPPIHDDRVLGLDGYNRVLDRYSEWLLEQRDVQGWEVIDLHFPMKQHLEIARCQDESYKLANDGIHPETEGHWIMAKEIISYLYPGFLKYDSWAKVLDNIPNMDKLYDLVYKAQDITKKAWLSEIGHNRPGIPDGLPIDEANDEIIEIRNGMSVLLPPKL